MTRADIASLLVTGRTLTTTDGFENVSGRQGRILGEQLAFYLGGALTQVVRQGLGQSFPLDIVTVGPDQLSTEVNPQIRFTDWESCHQRAIHHLLRRPTECSEPALDLRLQAAEATRVSCHPKGKQRSQRRFVAETASRFFRPAGEAFAAKDEKKNLRPSPRRITRGLGVPTG